MTFPTRILLARTLCVSSICSAMLLSGCEAFLYDTAQNNQQHQCRKYLGLSQYDECMDRIDTSFKDYKQQRDALLK